MKTVSEFSVAKTAGRKIAMVTAYDAASARLVAQTEVDCVLVGDSVMMVVHGEENTRGATADVMALHTKAVARGQSGKFLIADMPYQSMQQGNTFALECARMLIDAGANAVKIEGVGEEIIQHLVQANIPVMGHLGLLPQSVTSPEDYKVQAKTPETAQALHDDAATLERCGVFALVLECIPAILAVDVSAALKVPTIGIGAGSGCDGQVLVWHDLLGLNPNFNARFVRHFADGSEVLLNGLNAYARDVQSGKYPLPKESF
jgi:3-methyl-2-oxobutanoate hydroxymethyltransferase